MSKCPCGCGGPLARGSKMCDEQNKQMTYKQPGGELFTSWGPNSNYQGFFENYCGLTGHELREKLQKDGGTIMQDMYDANKNQFCNFRNSGPPQFCNSKGDCNDPNAECDLAMPFPRPYYNLDPKNLVDSSLRNGWTYPGGVCKTPNYPEADTGGQVGFHDAGGYQVPTQCTTDSDCSKGEACNNVYNMFGSGSQVGYCTTLQDCNGVKIPFLRPFDAGEPIYAPLKKCNTNADCRGNMHCNNGQCNHPFNCS